MALKKWFAAVAMAAGVFGASSASAALLTNGGFENPVQSNGSWSVYDSIDGWTKFAGTAGIEVQTGNVGGATAYEGSNKVELDSHSNSGMYQQVYLNSGAYQLSFQYLGRTENVSTNWINYDLEIGAVSNGQTNDNGTVFGINGNSAPKSYGWWNIVQDFTITSSGWYTLEFWADGTSDSYGGYIDDVQLSAVPLPPAMLLFGGAMLGLGWLSRRKKAA
ncbi:hypothetical protein [Sneathiella limimaris]|uniref:hypothetical protein n=1 Tax=Sneathiella limimaris TaxID=1964213 RepID=UPI00146E5E43|nr:hypothetical protein [Sneathiella limimaris]